MDSPSPSVLALQKAQDITSRWSDGELGADEAQHALRSLFDQWQPGTPENGIDEPPRPPSPHRASPFMTGCSVARIARSW